MSSMAEREKEADAREEATAPAASAGSEGTVASGRIVSEDFMEDDWATPQTAPELFTDPITVPVTLSEAQAEDLCVLKNFVYECSCYPHTPRAAFEVTLPDGCRANTWSHISDAGHDHRFLVFAISLRLDHMLINENRHADIFPESARQDRLEEEAFEAKRAEYRRTHPDAGRQPMKVTLTAPEPRI